MQIKRTIIFILFFITASMAMACDNKDDLSFLKEKMPYVEARKLLIEHGWKPFAFGVTDEKEILSACLKRVTSVDCKSKKMTKHCDKVLEICASLPEYGDCSADGYCSMVMENIEGKQLFINTYGDISLNNRHDDFLIIGWLLPRGEN